MSEWEKAWSNGSGLSLLLVWLDNLENIGQFKTHKNREKQIRELFTHVIYQKKSPEAN